MDNTLFDNGGLFEVAKKARATSVILSDEVPVEDIFSSVKPKRKAVSQYWDGNGPIPRASLMWARDRAQELNQLAKGEYEDVVPEEVRLEIERTKQEKQKRGSLLSNTTGTSDAESSSSSEDENNQSLTREERLEARRLKKLAIQEEHERERLAQEEAERLAKLQEEQEKAEAEAARLANIERIRMKNEAERAAAEQRAMARLEAMLEREKKNMLASMLHDEDKLKKIRMAVQAELAAEQEALLQKEREWEEQIAREEEERRLAKEREEEEERQRELERQQQELREKEEMERILWERQQEAEEAKRLKEEEEEARRLKEEAARGKGRRGSGRGKGKAKGTRGSDEDEDSESDYEETVELDDDGNPIRIRKQRNSDTDSLEGDNITSKTRRHSGRPVKGLRSSTRKSAHDPWRGSGHAEGSRHISSHLPGQEGRSIRNSERDAWKAGRGSGWNTIAPAGLDGGAEVTTELLRDFRGSAHSSKDEWKLPGVHSVLDEAVTHADCVDNSKKETIRRTRLYEIAQEPILSPKRNLPPLRSKPKGTGTQAERTSQDDKVRYQVTDQEMNRIVNEWWIRAGGKSVNFRIFKSSTPPACLSGTSRSLQPMVRQTRSLARVIDLGEEAPPLVLDGSDPSTSTPFSSVSPGRHYSPMRTQQRISGNWRNNQYSVGDSSGPLSDPFGTGKISQLSSGRIVSGRMVRGGNVPPINTDLLGQDLVFTKMQYVFNRLFNTPKGRNMLDSSCFLVDEMEGAKDPELFARSVAMEEDRSVFFRDERILVQRFLEEPVDPDGVQQVISAIIRLARNYSENTAKKFRPRFRREAVGDEITAPVVPKSVPYARYTKHHDAKLHVRSMNLSLEIEPPVENLPPFAFRKKRNEAGLFYMDSQYSPRIEAKLGRFRYSGLRGSLPKVNTQIL